MKRKIVLIISLVVITFLSQSISEENKIDWTKLPQLKGSGWGGGNIDTEPKKIGDLDEFDSLLEDGFRRLLKHGITDVPGMKEIDVKLSSSGFLKEKGLSYDGEKAFDHDLKTAWCEGAEGFGFRECLKLDIKFTIDEKNERYKSGVGIPAVLIYPGFGRSEDLFYKNNRLKSVILMVTAKEFCRDHKTKKMRLCKFTSAHRLKFEDVNKYHLFRIEDPYTIAREFEIYLYIEDVYKGSHYDDTCISDIKFYYY